VADRRVTGVLLVGGASRRFGSPKALARLGDETLAERGWRVLGETFADRIAVGKRADRLPLPFELVDDGTELRAPIAGVAAGLRAARGVCVFLPVDCPLVTPAALQALAEACLDAAVPPTGPLPGAYAESALPVLESGIERGELALHATLRDLRVSVVDLDDSLLVNVNTPAELAGLSG
jgi:molybdopterin-guanine dinucleotide biosynthesis protein A